MESDCVSYGSVLGHYISISRTSLTRATQHLFQVHGIRSQSAKVKEEKKLRLLSEEAKVVEAMELDPRRTQLVIVTKGIVKTMLPLSFVEKQCIRQWFCTSGQSMNLTRKHISRCVAELYVHVRSKLQGSIDKALTEHKESKCIFVYADLYIKIP